MRLCIESNISLSNGSCGLSLGAIQSVSHSFHLPDITTAIYDTDFGFVHLIFRDDQLPDTVKAILQNKAIMDIEDDACLGAFPLEIVGGYRYHMYVNADGRHAGKIYIGCEAYLADNFQKIPCKNPLYQRYFSACKANGRLDNNLSNMFGCVSEYMAACQTPEEAYCLNQLVNRLFSVVYA